MPPVHLDFIVAGFSKCGTTTLFRLLGAHPQIFVPSGLKEPEFFVQNDFAQRWEEYRRLFSGARTGQRLGEGSVAYTTVPMDTAARERILDAYPGIRLLFIARDPIDRIESSFAEYHHSGARYGLRCPFELDDALKELPEMIENSRYWERLSNYREHIAAEQLHVVFLEELKRDPESTLGGCFEFLGVDTSIPIAEPALRANARSAKLRDSENWRALCTDPFLQNRLSMVALETQDQLLVPLGLREPFPAGKIAWSAEARRRTADALCDDAVRFLTAFGKSEDYWPRFAELIGE